LKEWAAALLSFMVVISLASTTIYFQPDTQLDTPPLLNVKKQELLQFLKVNVTEGIPYQKYITPLDPAVRRVSEDVNGRVEAYSVAVRWVWVSDNVLNGVEEKWLTPHVFLVETPHYPTNPVKPREASDCEEQANTLVSVLRAENVSAEDVRVVIGKVRFRGEEGGHAWVEIYEDGKWLALEATSGPYYDEDKGRFINRKGMPYGFYRTHKYPCIEIWLYYNDVYYIDYLNKKENAPSKWHTPLIEEKTDSSSMDYQLFSFLLVWMASDKLLTVKSSEDLRKVLSLR